MWILFALTSATILASRKIQEKNLVGQWWQAIWWMIRVGSVVSSFLLWTIFSRDTSWIMDPTVIAVLLYCVIAYPLNVFSYLRSLHALPLSTFGSLSPIVLVVSLLISWIVFGNVPSMNGLIGVIVVGVGIIALFYKKEPGEIHISWVFFAFVAYGLMGLWYVLDRVALQHVNGYFYAFINQVIAFFSLVVMNHFFLEGTKLSFFRKNFYQLLFIWIIQGVSYYFSMYAISHAPNVGYAAALINTNVVLTTLYGIFILKEKVTKRKIFVFLCMMGALIAFAFA